MPLHGVDLHKKEDFKPTKQELEMIQDKMQDPEFRKLWYEYAESLADPKYRAEEEEYLRQIEKEAKEGGDNSFEFIFPTPMFYVELLDGSNAKKTPVYINMCESNKVEEFTEQTTNNRMGSNWHVPVSVGKEHEETHHGVKCIAFDAVFHPKTLFLTNRSDRFMCFVVEIAIENINNGYKKGYGYEFRRMTDVKSVGVPKNQTVKKKAGEALFKKSDEPVSLGPLKVEKEPPAPGTVPAAAKSTPAPAPTPAKAPTAAPKRGELKYTLAHRGEIDLTDAWNFKHSDKRIGIPKELVLKVELPTATSAAHIDLDVRETYVDVRRMGAPAYTTVALPFSVDTDNVGAKFDKSKQLLTLTLKVVPPSVTEAAQELADEVKRQFQPQGTHGYEDDEEAKAKEAARKAAEESARAEAQQRKAKEYDAARARQEAERKEAEAKAAAEVAAKREEELQAARRAQEEAEEAARKAKAKAEEEKEEAKKKQASAAAAAAARAQEEEPTSTPSPVKEADAGAAANTSHIQDQSRVQSMMAKLEEARREREQAEQGAAASPPSTTSSPQKATTPAKHVDPTDAAAPVAEDPAEVVDLRDRQRAWLEEENARKAKAELAAKQEQEEMLSYEARRKMREARRALEAEKETERLERAMEAKMAELPLKCKFIFALD